MNSVENQRVSEWVLPDLNGGHSPCKGEPAPNSLNSIEGEFSTPRDKRVRRRTKRAQEDKGKCRCGGCGLSFAQLSAFDKHRTGAFGPDRRCLTRTAMLEQGFSQDPHGRWHSPPRRDKAGNLKKSPWAQERAQ